MPSSVHINPDARTRAFLDESQHTLPSRVTGLQAYQDYLTKLHNHAMQEIRSKRGAAFVDNLLEAEKVQYILTVPAGWQSELRSPLSSTTDVNALYQAPSITEELRSAAFAAGLTRTRNSSSLDFCSEAEASALQSVGFFVQNAQ
jgi:hypothetical protein